MAWVNRLWRGGMVAFLMVSLLFSSGCALFLVGAGGAGGYMIRKGEEGDSPPKKGSSRLEENRPLMVVSASKWPSAQDLVDRHGATL